MKTRFSMAQLRDPNLAEADAILQTCNHFGFCTATCPTYVVRHQEEESPRGRIELIHAMLAEGGTPNARTVEHLDSCLSCLACISTCPANVDYMHLIDRARVHIEQHYRRPLADRLFRHTIASIIPYPGRLRLALRVARWVGPLAAKMGERWSNLARMAPLRLPTAQEGERPGTYPGAGAKRQRVALLTGCAQKVLAPAINAATIRVLNRSGCDVVVPAGGGCCGALTLHMGLERSAVDLARRNVDAWRAELEAEGFDAIVVNASGCGTTVKDYAHLLRNDPIRAEPSRQLAARSHDVSEFLDSLRPAFDTRMPPLRVAYHDACSLRNAQRVTDQPRRLLREAGFEVVEIPEAHFCCGSAGAYNMLQPRFAELLGRRKAAHVSSTRADVIATGNIGCITQLAQYADVPVVHVLQLLDWAMGGPVPEPLRTLPTSPRDATGTRSIISSDDHAIW